ncbi:MAG: hypothetical protein KKI09_04675 [Spirochaetes bacterium]|nr:hypothetical protein [Spirochaetota bacterium]MBU0954705.1 hypothetical protein [Spirochaetota bacterium]
MSEPGKAASGGNRQPNKKELLALGLGSGVAIGAGIGVAIDNIAIGIAIGVAMGPVIGLAMGRFQKKDSVQGDQTPN